MSELDAVLIETYGWPEDLWRERERKPLVKSTDGSRLLANEKLRLSERYADAAKRGWAKRRKVER